MMLSSSATRAAIRVGRSCTSSRVQQATPTTATATKCLLSTAAAPKQQPAEEVTFLRLNNLQDNPGAIKKHRRVGRGIGSSKGKTCGKGHKGQRARNRSSIPTGFEGGQTKFYKTLPKKGFSNKRHRQKQGADMAVLNLGTLQDYIDMGRLKIDNNHSALGVMDFINAGILKKKASLPGVKLLAGGKERFTAPVRLVVNRASEEAIEHAEQMGGQVTTKHFNRLAMRATIRPDKFPKIKAEEDASETPEGGEEQEYLLPKQARPPPKLQPYYTSWKNRGYLCPQVQMKSWLQQRPELEEAFEKALRIHGEDKTKEKKAVEEDK